MVTPEEMDKLDELAKRYSASGNNRTALTSEEWSFVYAVGLKLIEEHKNNLPDES